MKDKTRNSEVLADFVEYCEDHPDHRFWQALRNWSGYPFVLVAGEPPAFGPVNDAHDTFYWEGKDGQE